MPPRRREKVVKARKFKLDELVLFFYPLPVVLFALPLDPLLEFMFRERMAFKFLVASYFIGGTT